MSYKFKNAEDVEYEIVWRKPHPTHKAIGLCQSPDTKNPKIYIDPDLSERMIINTLIHECAHSFFWGVPEKKINKFANNVAKMIYTKLKELKNIKN